MIYDYTVKDIEGNDFSMEQLKGKVALIVNTASKCGLAPQFEGLEALYQEYKDQGFTIVGFPCGQFLKQEYDSEEEIASFCQRNYGVSFPMMEKVKVNGPNTHPLYQYLKQEQSGPIGKAIEWNFTKFLIDQEGNVVKRFNPKQKPEELHTDIQQLLS
ncbi:glutathione peroxidase [Aerococcaceae bacterium DSM 111020]|nr:glutathione peroxidase [Aerococcaceae bacterium DSM 111020]